MHKPARPLPDQIGELLGERRPPVRARWGADHVEEALYRLVEVNMALGITTEAQATADVFDYIERFYNPRRRHSTIGYLSPMQFEQKTRLA
jgi:hypothetical protein